MNLDALMSKAEVLLGFGAKDKWSALSVLCDAVVTAGWVPAEARQPLLDGLTAREKSLSTGMERGLAVPHAFVSCVEDTRVLIAHANPPIPWGALDGAPANLIVLLLAPNDAAARSLHLQVLAQLAGLWMQADRREAILDAADADALRAQFLDAADGGQFP